MSRKPIIFELLRASLGLLVCILLNINAHGALVTFPAAVWGHNPVNYYEVLDGIGKTRVVARPLAAGDQFSMQFDSLDALLRWKGGGEPPIIVSDRQYGTSVDGIESIVLPQTSSDHDRAVAVGYFNLRRAFNWHIPSVNDFVMPRGMAWMEAPSGVGQEPLSLAGVTRASIFGADPTERDDVAEKAAIADFLDPAEIAEKLDLASKPEPTILAILGVLAAMLIVAVLRVNFQLHR